MSDIKIHFLGEKDYLPAMENENRIWREQHVTNGRFTTRDGIRLNYYLAEHPSPRACVVIVHGYCECWVKYHEYAWYLWQAGYTVCFYEQRSHGYSGGKLPQFDVIHVDSFDTYVEDLREFVDHIVIPVSKGLPLLMMGHSMGGAVGALFLEACPKYFRGAVLSSPMFKLRAASMPGWKTGALKAFMHLTRSQEKLCFGEHRFIPEPNFSGSSALSKARYYYLFRRRVMDSHYRTAGASFGWVAAALGVNRLIMEHADKIKIPVTLMQAGHDALIDPAGFDEFMTRVPQAKKILYENSRHEIFNAGNAVRWKYFGDVIGAFEEMAAGKS